MSRSLNVSASLYLDSDNSPKYTSSPYIIYISGGRTSSLGSGIVALLIFVLHWELIDPCSDLVSIPSCPNTSVIPDLATDPTNKNAVTNAITTKLIRSGIVLAMLLTNNH